METLLLILDFLTGEFDKNGHPTGTTAKLFMVTEGGEILMVEIPITRDDKNNLFSIGIGKDEVRVYNTDGIYNLPALGSFFNKIQFNGRPFEVTSSEEGESEKRQGDNRQSANVQKLQLFPNYPNPVTNTTRIPFKLADPSNVTITIYTQAGQLVRTFNLGYRNAGSYEEEWDGKNESGENVADGKYFYKIIAGKFIATKSMVIIRDRSMGYSGEVPSIKLFKLPDGRFIAMEVYTKI